VSITKFHYISRSTTFILVIFPSEVVWKIQILKFKHSFAWQDDFKPKDCQLQNFITLQYLQLLCWWFFLSRSFSKFNTRPILGPAAAGGFVASPPPPSAPVARPPLALLLPPLHRRRRALSHQKVNFLRILFLIFDGCYLIAAEISIYL
jgi:hypothetical protein